MCNAIELNYQCIAYDKQVVHCIKIALLMISIILQCIGIALLKQISVMHRDCIAYNKHSCAIELNDSIAILMISIVVQCIGIALLMISIDVQYIGIALLMISMVVQYIGIALLMININYAIHWDCIAYDEY